MSEQPYYRQTAQQALESQQADLRGLSEAEVRRRAEQYGPNKLSEGKKKSTLQVFLEQFKDLLVIILIMFIGRLGAVTLLSMWIDHPEPRAHFTEETVSIG